MANSKKASVVVVEGEPAARTGLIHIIDSHPQLRVCAETNTLSHARQLCVQYKPQVLLVDLALGDGFALIKDLAKLSRQTRTVVFTAQTDAVSVQRAFQAGASAFLARRDPILALLGAIVGALHGERHVGPHVESLLLDRIASRGVYIQENDTAALSAREFQIFRLMGAGHSTRALADALGVSMKTVGTHHQRIKIKLGIQSGTELHRRAVLFHEAGIGAGHNSPLPHLMASGPAREAAHRHHPLTTSQRACG